MEILSVKTVTVSWYGWSDVLNENSIVLLYDIYTMEIISWDNQKIILPGWLIQYGDITSRDNCFIFRFCSTIHKNHCDRWLQRITRRIRNSCTSNCITSDCKENKTIYSIVFITWTSSGFWFLFDGEISRDINFTPSGWILKWKPSKSGFYHKWSAHHLFFIRHWRGFRGS